MLPASRTSIIGMEHALTMASKPIAFGSVGPVNAAAGLTISLLLGACSVSFPMPGFVDNAPTGSITEAGSIKVLSPALDREDVRRAKAALAVALDPQGSGTNVAWANPDSGRGGSFVPIAPPFPSHDSICRAFGGDILVHAEPHRRIKGSACRTSDGEWAIADLEEQK